VRSPGLDSPKPDAHNVESLFWWDSLPSKHPKNALSTNDKNTSGQQPMETSKNQLVPTLRGIISQT
jgi:hypothetical protein